MTIKTCYKCGESKEFNLFIKTKNPCKNCNNNHARKYYNDNRFEILQRQKEYREDNEEEIKERRKQKYHCNCGSLIRNKNKKLHEKSIKHIRFMNGIEKEVTVLVSYYNEERKKKFIKLPVDKFKELENERNKLMRVIMLF